MDGPISPPPVGGTAGNELQYVKWRRGLKVRDNPLSPVMALLSNSLESIPKEKIEDGSVGSLSARRRCLPRGSLDVGHSSICPHHRPGLRFRPPN
jgi:hypothetical protein